MSATTLEIRSDLKIQLDLLAEESHRSESDLANEAVALYLAQQRRISARIQEGLAQAQRGEFVSDEDMEAFFARYLGLQITTKSVHSYSGE
jgi:predicted transcriptional regulator